MDSIRKFSGSDLKVGDIINATELGDGFYRIVARFGEDGYYVEPCDEKGNLRAC